MKKKGQPVVEMDKEFTVFAKGRRNIQRKLESQAKRELSTLKRWNIMSWG